MALRPPPKELSRQRKHKAKYANRQKAENQRRRELLLARLKEMERERAEQFERESRRRRSFDNSPTVSDTKITITTETTGCNFDFE